MHGSIACALVLRLPELVPLSSAAPSGGSICKQSKDPNLAEIYFQIASGVTHMPQIDIWCSHSVVVKIAKVEHSHLKAPHTVNKRSFSCVYFCNRCLQVSAANISSNSHSESYVQQQAAPKAQPKPACQT